MISPTTTDQLEECEPALNVITERVGPQLKAGTQSLVFDIETGPAATDLIKSLSEPYKQPAPLGDFDSRSVRTGNLKDPDKIMAKIEEAKQAHLLSVANQAGEAERGEAAYWAKIVEDSPLSPILGRVLAIGFCDAAEHTHSLAVGSIHDDDAEADIIDEFWCRWYVPTVRGGHSLIGHYIGGFDIPFLVRRSWILGVDVPPGLFESGGRYLSRAFIDTRTVWDCGTRGSNVPGNLDMVGRVLGEGGKTEGMTGADFWKLFYTGEVEKVEQALAYLRNDVVINSRVARRMGVM